MYLLVYPCRLKVYIYLKKILTDPEHLNGGVYFWYNKINKTNIST